VWRRLFPDVYVHRETTVDRLTHLRAAALLLPEGSALSHGSAAYLLGAPALDRAPTVHVTVPPPARLRATDGLVVHRCRLPAGSGDVLDFRGLPVTSPGRTAFDLGRVPDLDRAVVALDLLLHRRVIGARALRDGCAARLGWPGVARFRAAVALAREGAESPMESRLRLVVVRGGLAEPATQHTVRDRAGVAVGRLDLAYETARVGLEYDGDQHRERERFRRDAVRLNRLRLAGWTVLRFTADDVLRHPDRVVRQVRAVLHDRDE
jgi:very-short-patch-repair endonuclease